MDKQWLGFSHLQWGHPSFVNTKLLTNIHWHQYAAKQAKKVNSKCRVVKKLAASSTTNKVPVESEKKKKKIEDQNLKRVDAKTQMYQIEIYRQEVLETPCKCHTLPRWPKNHVVPICL